MKITKEQYEEAPAWLKKHFKPILAEGETDESTATEYSNGEEDAKAIKSARDRERDAAKKLRQEKAELEARVAELEEAVEGAGDSKGSRDEEIKALKERYKAQIQKAKEDHQKAVDDLMSKLRKTHVSAVAKQLAAEISTVPDLMAREIERFLGVNLDGDEPTTEVLDADGKPTAETLQELKEKFISNKAYASILIGSKGSGGGAGGGGNGGGAFDIAHYRNTDGTTNWTRVHEAMKTDPTVYQKVRDANTEAARGGYSGGQSQKTDA